MRISSNPSTISPVLSVAQVAARNGVAAERASLESDSLRSRSTDTTPAALPIRNLTPDALRDTLLEIGFTADSENLELAEAFARLGLPINESTVSEGRALLSRYAKLPAEAYAMAKLLDAPLSAGVLRALQRVVEDAMDKSALPADLLSELTVALDGSGDAARLAKELYALIARFGRSTERQLAEADDAPDAAVRAQLRADPRAQLLAVAASDSISIDRTTRIAADVHAGHIEGQQLLNQIALQRFDPPVPLYFAFPYRLAADETAHAEIQVWTRDEDEEKRRGASGKCDSEELVLQTVVRLSPPRLGRLEFRLTGRQDAVLACHVLAEQPSALRLLQRHAPELARGLADAGWNVAPESVTIERAANHAPLWYCGALLAQPRSRVDRKI